MGIRVHVSRFFFMFFTFFSVRVIGDVLLRTPEETMKNLYSLVPYVSALIVATVVTGYYYFINKKKEQQSQG
jgi:hypothetical protein